MNLKSYTYMVSRMLDSKKLDCEIRKNKSKDIRNTKRLLNRYSYCACAAVKKLLKLLLNNCPSIHLRDKR